jgi:hypothetical protein
LRSQPTIFAILACLTVASLCCAQTPPRGIDARRATAAGLRILEGRHIKLLTDLPTSAAVDELPQVFDAAITEWAAYFDMPANKVRGRWLGCIIQDREKFAALDLLPDDNPNFINGYARGFELWLMDQPSDYYRRHLLLHEGTHAFMQTQLGGAGPGWYMEGIAELLGTHRWQNGRLKLGVMPASRGDTPMWGRIKIIRDAVAAKKAWPINAVLEVDNRRPLATDHYAWTWALTTLLDGHPQYRERFRSMKQYVADPAFNERFRGALASDWSDLLAEWDALVSQLDYGYDFERMAMVHKPAEPVGASSERATIAADRGWQATGWLLRGGETYRVSASGRFQIADDGKPWPCEPGGVTIEYHDGRPLGALLGALRPGVKAHGASTGVAGPGQRPGLQRAVTFASPMVIGLEATVKPHADGVLYLRVNDSPAKLGDNDGGVAVRIEAAAKRRPHLAPGQ